MAYARFSRDSDLYIYESTEGGWVCCRCSLSERQTAAVISVGSRSRMMEHLRQHEAKGDKVPPDAIEELQNEIKALGDAPPSP